MYSQTMHTPLPDNPISAFSRSVFTLNGLLLDAGESIAKPLGLSVAKWHVLGRANYKDRTVAQIARYIGVTRQSVQRIANDLERDGLVEFTPSPSDARTQLVTLTDEGRHLLDRLYTADKLWSETLMTRLDINELEKLTIQLNDLSKKLANYTDRSFDEA